MNIKGRNLFTGFTLVELIIVILLIGILSGVLFNIIRGPVLQYVQLEQRTNMVDIAETALLRMTREIRLALPNSIRITGGTTVEFLRTLDGGRYRAKPGGAGPALCGGAVAQDRLNFANTTDCFEVLGTLVNVADIVTGTARSECIASTADCMVIFNTGQSGADAYSEDNIAVVTSNFLTANSIEFAGAPPFPYESPRQRFYIVDTPVSFVCDTGLETIRRIDNYSITAGVGAATGELLVDQVTACDFTYDQGTSSRAGLVTLSITITDSDLGQSVTLLQQSHVDNQP